MDFVPEWLQLTEEKLSIQDVHVVEKDYLHKLKYNRQFILIKKTGLSLKKSGLILKHLKTNDRDIKWAVSASKYAYKKSVDRNYAKRRLRELIRNNPPILHGNYLLSATHLTNKISFEELKHEYITLLSKIRY